MPLQFVHSCPSSLSIGFLPILNMDLRPVVILYFSQHNFRFVTAILPSQSIQCSLNSELNRLNRDCSPKYCIGFLPIHNMDLRPGVILYFSQHNFRFVAAYSKRICSTFERRKRNGFSMLKLREEKEKVKTISPFLRREEKC